jgi:hypothetical protein
MVNELLPMPEVLTYMVGANCSWRAGFRAQMPAHTTQGHLDQEVISGRDTTRTKQEILGAVSAT